MTHSAMLYPRASEAEALRQSEVRHAVEVAAILFVACLFLSLCATILGMVAQVPLPTLTTLLAGLFALWAACVFVLCVVAWHGGRRQLRAVGAPKVQETKPEVPAAGLPTLPTSASTSDNDTFRLTANGRVEDVPKQLVHGFDVRDLWWLCNYMADGNKFTEAAMETLRLPYSRELMGQSKEGTHYTRWTNLCVRAGVVTGRGGPGNKAGTLAVTDANEILRLIKAQPE